MGHTGGDRGVAGAAAGQRGRSPFDSNLAMEIGPLLRAAFGRPWRQTEGLLRSITTLLGVSLEIPDHATFSRRSIGVSLTTTLLRSNEPVHVVLDSTGLKVYEAGEMAMGEAWWAGPHVAPVAPRCELGQQ